MNKRPQKILIYRIGQLGDMIVSLPAFWAIRQFFPDSYIALLSDKHNNSNFVLASQLFSNMNLFNELIYYNANESGGDFFNIFKMIPILRQIKFTILIYLAPRYRKKYQVIRDLTFFRLAGIKYFIGHKGFQLYPQRPFPSLLHKFDHTADHFLYRLSLSGIPVPSQGKGLMDLCLKDQERSDAIEWIKNKVKSQHGPLIGFGVGSKCPAKIWPEERYEAVGRYIINTIGGFPIVFGGLEDRIIGARLIRKWRCGANAAGELNVRQAAAALSICRLYIGNDTGTMHLAAAVKTKCIAIFSARHFPECWYPYGLGHIVLRRRVPCEGCTVFECNEHDNACLKLIQVEDVIEAVEKILPYSA